MTGFESIADVRSALGGQRYMADDGLAFAALRVGRPVAREGARGVGKTELAKALAGATGSRLIRLQCYEGIDVHHALYDWDYPRQLLHLRGGLEGELYGVEFLLRRPLL